MAEQPRVTYGGQAVIEGVMIRGREYYSLAVRRPDGHIFHYNERLNTAFTGPIRRIPLLRGVLVLMETLLLGIKTLNRSAALASTEGPNGGKEEIPGWLLALTLIVSLTLGVGIFFILPLLVVRIIDPFIASDVVSNLIEGAIRLVILVAYICGIGMMKDIRRVFAYHGAEHMAVHTYEAGLDLTVENVRKFNTPHPRCGTAFLLTVVLVSIVVFAFLGRPDLEWRILSRIMLIPVVAAISYEFIRFSGLHPTWAISKLIAGPGLWLQRLTTRQPEDDQIEVAITAMGSAVAADAGLQYDSPFEDYGFPQESGEGDTGADADSPEGEQEGEDAAEGPDDGGDGGTAAESEGPESASEQPS